MSSSTLAHRSVASIKGAPTINSPSTPQRPIASTYGSPSTIRADDDIVVLQLGSRFLKAGFAGDSSPKAVLSCGPDQQRRVGDFRAWQRPGLSKAWAEDYELWRYDLRDVDLELFQDKLDRVLRDAFGRYLLIDSRPRRTSLVLDPAVPIPLLSAVLDVLFNNFQSPIISLVSIPSMTAVAAGVRSALVIDMGWAETVVTSVYEYREVKATRSIRGGKQLLDRVHEVLKGLSEEATFDECEEVIHRLMWCRSSTYKSSQRQSAQLETVEEQDETAEQPTTQIARIPLKSPPTTIEVPFEKLADVCDDNYFEQKLPVEFDDEELPAHLLVYQHLLQLPVDVRAVCMSRIMFTGGCSNILGIKERIVDELTSIVERRGWEAVTGKGAELTRSKAQDRVKDPTPVDTPDPSSPDPATDDSTLRAIEARLARNRKAEVQIQGQIRAVESLGPWTGASLLSQLKVPAMATIDRELWLQQGANGASRPSEVDVKAQQRQSMGAGGLIRSSGGHHSNWTLGAWGQL